MSGFSGGCEVGAGCNDETGRIVARRSGRWPHRPFLGGGRYAAPGLVVDARGEGRDGYGRCRGRCRVAADSGGSAGSVGGHEALNGEAEIRAAGDHSLKKGVADQAVLPSNLQHGTSRRARPEPLRSGGFDTSGEICNFPTMTDAPSPGGSRMDGPSARKPHPVLTPAAQRAYGLRHASAAPPVPEPSPVVRDRLLPPGLADFRPAAGAGVSARNRPAPTQRHPKRWYFPWAQDNNLARPVVAGPGMMPATSSSLTMRWWSGI